MTVLPAVFDEFKTNVCATIDIPIIHYLSNCRVSTPDSRYVTHVSDTDLAHHGLSEIISDALSQNKAVKVRGQQHAEPELSLDYLDRKYAISPKRAVWAHGSVSAT
jgi:hypothetical protein